MVFREQTSLRYVAARPTAISAVLVALLFLIWRSATSWLLGGRYRASLPLEATVIYANILGDEKDLNPNAAEVGNQRKPPRNLRQLVEALVS